MTIRSAYSSRENGRTQPDWAFQFKPFIFTNTGLEYSVVFLIDKNMMLEHCICEDLRKAQGNPLLCEELKFYDCGYETFRKLIMSNDPNNRPVVEDYRVHPDNLLNFLIALIIKRTNMQNGTIEWQSVPR